MTPAQKWIRGLAFLVVLCLVSAEAVAAPSISSLSFTSVPADSTPRTLTIYGDGFAAGNVVRYRWLNPVGSNYTSASVSSASQLSASFNPGAVTDTIYVKVCQSSTSTACSGELTIAVTATPPPGPTTGNLTVTVQRSDTNAPLSGATVSLSGGPSSPASQTTGLDGTTTFSDLAVGNYTVRASLAEFKTNNVSATVVANTPPVAVSLTPSQELEEQKRPPEISADTTCAPTTADKAIVITHGWNSDASTTKDVKNGLPSWPVEMAQAFCKKLDNTYNGCLPNDKPNGLFKICQANGWDVWVYDWRTDANSSPFRDPLTGSLDLLAGIRFPVETLPYAHRNGATLAIKLWKSNYQHYHLIAHSAGAMLIDWATYWLKQYQHREDMTIHETFLDAYGPAEVDSYGAWADWADNYVDTRWPGTDLFLSEAYSIDTTPSWGCGPICAHSQPYRFYGLSILNDGSFVGNADYKQSDPIYSTAVRGYPLSVEDGRTLGTLSNSFPPGGQCKVTPVNGGTCAPGSHPMTIVEYYGSGSINSAVENSSNAVVFPSSSPLQRGILYDRVDLGPGLVSSNYVPKQMIAMRESATSGAATEEPSYLVVNVTTTSPVNTLRFNWSFAAAGEGLLRVFVGGNLMREIDQRYVTPSSPETEEVYIGGVDGPLPPGTYRITFRLDGFSTSASASGVELTAVELGLLAVVNPTLTVTKAGTGTGTVTSVPAGIDCGADCSESYAAGTAVTLTATPATGSTFTSWGGNCNSSGQVTLDAAKTCTATFTAIVNGPLVFSTTSLPTGERGAAYQYTVQVTGGMPPYYTWSFRKLPPGLDISLPAHDTFTLFGTPTKAKTTTFSVQVTDASGASATQNFSLRIVKGVTIKTKKLRGGTVGTSYSSMLKTKGGIAPLTFSVAGGALPPGLTLDPGTGQVSGTPAAAGIFDFVAQVTSSGGASHQKNIRIKIK